MIVWLWEHLNSIVRKTDSSISVAFVNNSISKNAFSSPCARFSSHMEGIDFGSAYRSMNAGYRRLSEIAYPVATRREAFELVVKAFGSVEKFFKLLEEQRSALESYARSLIANGWFTCLKGLFLLQVAEQAKGWGRKFRLEYTSTSSIYECRLDHV